MTVFFTSDPHIGHKFVARLRYEEMTGYKISDTNVILDTIDEWHDGLLAQNWDETVKSDDLVWVLGDISAGGTSSQVKALEWMSKRPGRKHLIAGNHDGVHPMHRTSYLMFPSYMEVFDSVQQSATRKIALPNGVSQKVLLSHFPYSGDHTPGDRFDQFRLKDMGMPILHGHVHTNEKVTYTDHREPTPWMDEEGTMLNQAFAPAKQIHVGLDAWDLTPVPLEAIAELLT